MKKKMPINYQKTSLMKSFLENFVIYLWYNGFVLDNEHYRFWFEAIEDIVNNLIFIHYYNEDYV